MLFNWVQPLFNRYAQRCAKGVTRVEEGPRAGVEASSHSCFRQAILLSHRGVEV